MSDATRLRHPRFIDRCADIRQTLMSTLDDGVKSTESTLSEQLYKLGSIIDH